jgi:hypothetical protein
MDDVFGRIVVERAIAVLSRGNPYQFSTDRPDHIALLIKRAAEIGAVAYPIANLIPEMESINRCIVLIPKDPSAESRVRVEDWGLHRRDEVERSEQLYFSLRIRTPIRGSSSRMPMYLQRVISSVSALAIRPLIMRMAAASTGSSTPSPTTSS